MGVFWSFKLSRLIYDDDIANLHELFTAADRFILAIMGFKFPLTGEADIPFIYKLKKCVSY